MAVKFNGKLELNPGQVVSRFHPKYEKAQIWLDNEVIKDSERYVPMRQGILRRSAVLDKNFKPGLVRYFGPYAKFQYYGGDGKRVVRNYTTPGTGAQWFEKAKAVSKDKWLKGVEKIIKE